MDHLTIRKWLVTGVSEPKKTYITGINFTNWERLRKKTGLLTYEDRGMILQVLERVAGNLPDPSAGWEIFGEFPYGMGKSTMEEFLEDFHCHDQGVSWEESKHQHIGINWDDKVEIFKIAKPWLMNSSMIYCTCCINGDFRWLCKLPGGIVIFHYPIIRIYRLFYFLSFWGAL